MDQTGTEARRLQANDTAEAVSGSAAAGRRTGADGTNVRRAAGGGEAFTQDDTVMKATFTMADTPSRKKLEETTMDMGTKLEHALRHLKNAEPAIEHWQEFADVGRSTEVSGVLLNSGWLDNDARHMVDGLVLAVHLLAKKCAALERDVARLDTNARDATMG
jgi:hypothetical protein